jgi:hypothetical protein
MRSVPVVMQPSRPWLLLFLTALVLTWTGGASAAEQATPSPDPAIQALFASETDCASPENVVTELPELLFGAQWKGGSGVCSPYCGYAACRGALVGSICTTSTGNPGTCYGPPLGKKCADGLPMCLCVAG